MILREFFCGCRKIIHANKSLLSSFRKTKTLVSTRGLSCSVLLAIISICQPLSSIISHQANGDQSDTDSSLHIERLLEHLQKTLRELLLGGLKETRENERDDADLCQITVR